MDEVVKTYLRQKRVTLGRRLGCGGFAEVWEATSPSGVPCAIKVSLRPLEESGEESGQILHKELKTLQSLKQLTGHPHLVSLREAEMVGGIWSRSGSWPMGGISGSV